MREVTNLMVNEFKIREKKIDFMGYKVDRVESLTFHHMIVPRRDCKKKRIPNEGYVRWNGAILTSVSHQYLHTIENYDYEKFLMLTSELMDENVKGKLTKENLLEIRHILESFEAEFGGKTSKKGHQIVRPEYKILRLRKDEIENF